MKIGYFVDSFDPVTNKHIEFAKKLVKDNQLSALYFVAERNGIADCNNRIAMLNRAISPCRKFKVFKGEFDKNDECAVFIDKTLATACKSVREGDFSLLNYSNKRYIMENGLYANSIIRAMLNEKRYLHSVSVANLCKEIADGNNLDSHKAYIIGIYHDIAKNFSKEKLKYYMDIYEPYEYKYDYLVWHQCVAEFVLKGTFKMKDKKEIKAIRHHCLGDDNDVYSKIIFIADKLDPLRGYDSSREIKLALKDVDKAFKVVKKQNEEYLKAEGRK